MTDANRPQATLTIEQRAQRYLNNIIRNAILELKNSDGQSINELHAHIEKTIQRYRQALITASHYSEEMNAVRKVVLDTIGNPKTLPAFYEKIISRSLDMDFDTKKTTGHSDLDKMLADLENWTPKIQPSSVPHPKFLKENTYAFLLLDTTKNPAKPFSPQQVAQHIFNGQVADLGKIGEFLSEINPDSKKPEPHPYAQAVLSEYAKLSVKSGMSLPDALRTFLDKFKLPGEAQKIDRIMEMFAKTYHEQNKNQFPSQDDAYRTAFATIMLATDLHNPAIKKKMTQKQFVQNTGLSFDKANTPDNNPAVKKILEDIYVNIKAKPLELKKEAVKQKGFASLLEQWKNLSTLQTAYVETNRSKLPAFNVLQSNQVDKISEVRKQQLHVLQDAATKAATAYADALKPKNNYDLASDLEFKKRAEQASAKIMLGAIGNVQQELKKENNYLGSRLDKMLIDMETQIRTSVIQPNLMNDAKRIGLLDLKETENNIQKSHLHKDKR